MNIIKLWNNNPWFRFGIKAGLAYGAVYYIAEQGVWKSSDEAVLICNKISQNVDPYTQELTKHIPYKLPSLPQTNEITYLMNYYWNRGVLASCAFLADLPGNVSSWTNQGIEFITENPNVKNMFSQEEQVSQPVIKSEK